MKLKQFLLLGLVTCIMGFKSPATYTLTVNVDKIKAKNGNIKVCIITKKATYLKGCDLEKVTPASDTRVTLVFTNLPEGKYAINVHHDEDGNGKVNQGLMGIPSEPYGFSNNPSTFFGPPDYEDCLFDLSSDKEVTIKL